MGHEQGMVVRERIGVDSGLWELTQIYKERGKGSESLGFQLSNHVDVDGILSKEKRSGLGVETYWRIP